MKTSRSLSVSISKLFLAVAAVALPLSAQTAPPANLITNTISPTQLTTLPGSTYPLARPEFDAGAAPPDLAMRQMLLVLKRSPQQQAALDQLLADQQEPLSPNYHRWLTPDEFGQQFGLSDGDINAISSWLGSQGFEIDHVSKGRTSIVFSGTAAQVQNAFHTPIHEFIVNGEQHWANSTDPQIPSALIPAVAGVASLHNFGPKPQVIVSGASATSPAPLTTINGSHYLSPGDYAIIYNLNPLFQNNFNGAGTTIAIVGRTDIKVSDVNNFRSIFGLPANPPTLVVNGPDPGDLGGGEEVEAVLDVSWSGATAPGAAVDLVVSQSTNTTDGVFLSEEYIINNTLPPNNTMANVMSESFGDCEANYSQAEASNLNAMAQQAAAEGITYLVSGGDAGSAGCDDFDTETSATGPVSANMLASPPTITAVGGTQFDDNANPGAYWSSTNGTNQVSALSYIPEDVWNANCFENSCYTGSILAGGGGASVFFAKPSWQSGIAGIPNDGVRDLPDVSLTASGHDQYLLCLDGDCSSYHGGMFPGVAVYGTSAAAPSFAGMVAVLNQATGSRQGNINPVLYQLARGETLGNCNASNTAGLPASNCIFNDVTVGTNAVPGETGYNTGTETYPAKYGYDLASGLGSVNAANLVNGWTSGISNEAVTGFSPQTVPPFFYPDPNAVELGVKFRSSVSGYVTGVRFYKNSSDTNVHTGSLWSGAGQLLATGTFSGETASGWQQLTFSTPIAISPNTTYIASYHTSSGYYTSNNYFTNQGQTNGPITLLQAGVDGPNGVGIYGPGGLFPNQSYMNSNYWADVVFSTAASSTPAATNIFLPGTVPYNYYPDPASVELGVKFRSDVPGYVTGVRFYKNSVDTGLHLGSVWGDNGQLLTTGTFTNETPSGWQQLTFATPAPIAAGTTYIASYHTSTGYYTANSFFTAKGVDNGTLHALESGVDGVNGVGVYSSSTTFPNSYYENSNYWADLTFSTTVAQPPNLFQPGTVAYIYYADPQPVELGVKFRSSVAGHITGVRFYKNPADTSVHTGSLWSDSGQLLATGTFSGETASGWQQLNFSTPVAISPNTTYIASYHTSTGYYTSNNYFTNQGLTNGNLQALQGGVDGPNGVGIYGPGGLFPNQSYMNSNYWVDIVFSVP